MLADIAADAEASQDVAERTLIFVGDYVDRGPDSRQVVEMLITSLPQGFDVHFLKGNHEAILLDFLEDASWLDYWRANGADATLLSYERRRGKACPHKGAVRKSGGGPSPQRLRNSSPLLPRA